MTKRNVKGRFPLNRFATILMYMNWYVIFQVNVKILTAITSTACFQFIQYAV